MNKHVYLLAKAALLALLALAFSSTPAAADETRDLIKRYGFESRAAELPYGVPVKATLSDVTLGGTRYQIDRASPLNEAGKKGVIKAYLQTHASNEIALIAYMFGGPVGKVKVDVRKASTMVFPPSESELHVSLYRVTLAPIVEKGETFTVDCDFKFIQVGKQSYALYYSGKFDRMNSEQPHCDVSSSATKVPM